VDEDWLTRTEEYAEAIILWRAVGARCLYIVPLVVGDRTIGALTLVDVKDSSRFTPEMRALVQRYALAAALALENARLYAAARRATSARDEVLAVVSHDLRNRSARSRCARGSPRSAAHGRGVTRCSAITEATVWMVGMIRDQLTCRRRSRPAVGAWQRSALGPIVSTAVGW
jgi:hypothetical protein